MLHNNSNWRDRDGAKTDSISVSPCANGRSRGIRIDGIDELRRRVLRLEPPLPISKINNTTSVVFVDVDVSWTTASVELFVVVGPVASVDIRPTHRHLSAHQCTTHNQKQLMSAHCCNYRQCQCIIRHHSYAHVATKPSIRGGMHLANMILNDGS